VSTSFWLDRDASRPEPDPLDGDTTADVAIVGGGIAGIACAQALVRDGASVVLLERRQLASGASGRNAGFVLGGVADSYAAAAKRYGPERALRIFGVTFTARALVRSAIREAAIACDDRWEGSDQLAGDAAEWDELTASAAQLSAHGVAVTLDPVDRRAAFPPAGCPRPVPVALVDVFLAGVLVGLGDFDVVVRGLHGVHAIEVLGRLLAFFLGFLGVRAPVDQGVLGVRPKLLASALLDREGRTPEELRILVDLADDDPDGSAVAGRHRAETSDLPRAARGRRDAGDRPVATP